jgi:hypothetical protein
MSVYEIVNKYVVATANKIAEDLDDFNKNPEFNGAGMLVELDYKKDLLGESFFDKISHLKDIVNALRLKNVVVLEQGGEIPFRLYNDDNMISFAVVKNYDFANSQED